MSRLKYHLMLIVLLGLCLILLGVSVPDVGAEESGTTIRVLLNQGGSTTYYRVVEGEYSLVDLNTRLQVATVSKGEFWQVNKKGSLLQVSVEGNELPIAPQGPLLLQPLAGGKNLFSVNNTIYRDELMITNEQQGLLIVNRLDLEHYLYGVVGQEMGNFAETEALEAQAVVSRTYALVSRSVRYDVTTDTSSQVFGGYGAELTPGFAAVYKAVDSTRGQVIYYEGNLIQAFFHSNSGGYTEDAKNVWGRGYDYIQPVKSPFDSWALDYPTQVGGWPANTYSWTKDISREEIEVRFSDLGKLEDIQVSYLQEDGSPTVSGRATGMTITGSLNNKVFSKDGIRSALGLRSTRFKMETDSGITILDGTGQVRTAGSGIGLVAVGAGGYTEIPNGETTASYYVQAAGSSRELSKVLGKVMFEGWGYGHGVGMSQWGARGMAKEGYNYQQIIQHYYNQDKNDGKLIIKTYQEQQADGSK